MRCRFCESEAVVIAVLPGGCWVHPEDRIFPLCEHHYRRATPLDGMTVTEDLTDGDEFTKEYPG